jgi:hypothetical protein
MKVSLEFDPQEVNAILAGLSALPTGHGVWPLALRIKQEAEAQLPQPEAASESSEAAE